MPNSAFTHDPSFTIPGSTTDNAVIRWDGTSGAGQQNSGILIDDSNVITGITSLTVDNLNINGNTIISTDSNGSITFTPNGSGSVVISKVDINSGDITGVTISGGLTWSAAQNLNSQALTNVNIDSGDISAATVSGSLTWSAAQTFGAVTATQVDITAAGDLRLQDSTGGQYVALEAAGTTTSHTLTLPAAQGGADTVLTNNGSGALSWAAAAGGASLNGSTANGVLSYGSSSVADVEANLTFNGSVLDLRSSNSGSANGLLIYNSNTAANSAAQIRLIVEDTNNAGTDAEILFETGSNMWSIGTDNSDADAWVITRAGTLGDRASQRVRIDDLVFRIHAEEAVSSPYGALAITSRDDLSGANGNFGIVFQQMTSSDTLSATRGSLYFSNTRNEMTMTGHSGAAFTIESTGGGILNLKNTSTDAATGTSFIRFQGASNSQNGYVGFGSSTEEFHIVSEGDNSMKFYTNGGLRLTITNTGTFSGSSSNDISDERIKENIEDTGVGLAEILQLHPVKFNFQSGKGWGKEGQKFYGLLAQEVEAVIPEAVHTDEIDIDEILESDVLRNEDGEVIGGKKRDLNGVPDLKSVGMSQITTALIKAVQELNAKVDALS